MPHIPYTPDEPLPYEEEQITGSVLSPFVAEDQEQERQQAAPEPEQDQPLVDSPDEEDRWAAIESRQNAFQQFMLQQIQELRRSPQKQEDLAQQSGFQAGQQHFQQPQGWVDPAFEEYNRLKQSVNRLEQQQVQLSARQAQWAAVEAVRRDYPDLYDHIPEGDLRNAFDTMLQRGDINRNWRMELEHEYLKRERVARGKKSDELTSKRQEKQSTSLKAAANIAPGGNVYQRQQPPKADRRDRNYKAVREAWLHDVEAAGG